MSKPFRLRQSPVHGTGLFATETLEEGIRLIEYQGKRVDWSTREDNETGHTFLMGLNDGRVIDGAIRGSRARYINHSCDPNCETYETDGRIFVHTRRAVGQGEELTLDYQLVVGGRITAAVKQRYACRCGSVNCRKTMLALPAKV
jgi:SET domain-containing protein